MDARDEGCWETPFEGRYEREPAPEPAPRLGGEVVAGPRGPDGGRIAVVRDQAGATLALWESKSS